MAALVALGVVVAALVGLWFFAEGKRRDREPGRRRPAGAAAVRAGLLEMQNLLEPERRVEVARDLERKADLLVDVQESDDPGDSGPAR